MRSIIATILVYCAAQITSAGNGVLVRWSAPADTNIIGYRLHLGTASHDYSVQSDVGNTTAWTISNLAPGQQYFMSVTSLNGYEESGYSKEIVYTAPSNQPPAFVDVEGQTWGSEFPGNGLIVNGGFDDGVNGWTTIGLVSTIPDTDGSASLAFAAGTSPESAIALQALATIPGQRYRLSFDFAPTVGFSGTNEVLVTVQSPGLSLHTNFISSPDSQVSGIRTEIASFVATDTRTILSFQDASTTGAAANFTLDNVAVTEALVEGPVFAAPVGKDIRLALRATDLETDASKLSYSLLTPLPGATVDSAGIFRWKPSAEMLGTTNELFIQVNDNGNQATSPASDRKSFTIVVVEPENSAPVAKPDLLNAAPDATSRLSLAFLLRNDYDIDGDSLRVEQIDSVSQNGGEAIISNGHLFYTPPAGYTGPDLLTYTISDGHNHLTSSTISVNVKITAKPKVEPTKLVRVPSGEMEVYFQAAPNMKFAVDASPDLVSWTRLGIMDSETNGQVKFIDNDASRFPIRFYRLTLP